MLFLIGLMAHTTHAQKRTQDAIHLKNGSVIRNASGMKHLDSLIEVQTRDGSTIRFAATDLEKIVREPVKPAFRTKGYFLGAEVGMGLGKTYEPRNGMPAQATQKLQVQVVNGYWFTPRWAATVRKPTTIGATILKAAPTTMLSSAGCRCGWAGCFEREAAPQRRKYPKLASLHQPSRSLSSKKQDAIGGGIKIKIVSLKKAKLPLKITPTCLSVPAYAFSSHTTHPA